MKLKLSFFTALIGLIFSLAPLNSYATHIMGGEITWECLSNGLYVFKFKVYRDCSGNALGPRGSLWIHNYPNPGNVTLIANNAEYDANTRSDLDISPTCLGGGTFSCANGDAESIFEYTREADPMRLNGSPPVEGWIITYSDVARNATTNLSQVGITLRAKIFPHSGTVADSCKDNSPLFRERATSLLCIGNSFTYNHNATDVELDSLFYEWAQPLLQVPGYNTANPSLFVTGSVPNQIAFQTGYSFNSPFPSNVQDPRNSAAVLDGATGEIAMTSFTSGKYVSAVKVSAYKCGEKVAEIFRELQSNISASCATNNQPNIRAPFQDNNGNFTQFSDTVRAGDPVAFNIQVTDFDMHPNGGGFQTVTLEGTGLQFGTNYTSSTTGCPNPPCATLTSSLPQSGLAGVNTSFNWQTDCNHISFNDGCVSLENTYTFVIRAVDNACPIPAQNIATISVTVLADSVIKSPDINCLDIQANGDVIIDWNTTPDPNNSFTAWMIYSGTNANGPFSLVDSVKNYSQTSYTHTGAGAQQQRRWYYIRSRSGCKGLVQNVAKDTLSTIFVVPSNNATNVTVDWNELTVPNPVGSATRYDVYRNYPVGSGLSLYQSTSSKSLTENFNLCEDTVVYQVELTNAAAGCNSTSNLAGYQFKFPDPQTNFSFPPNPCPLLPISFTNLTSISGGTVTYTWDFGDASPTVNTTSPTHTYQTAGTYTIQLTANSALGCDSVMTQQITITLPDADAGIDRSICPGGIVQIGGSPTSSTLNVTYAWSPPASLSNAAIANPMASPNTTTDYSVIVTDPSGCTNTDTMTVFVNAVPTADAGGPQTICLGQSATIGGAPTGPGGATYLWDNATSLSNATDPNPTATPTTTTTYTVTVTSGVNCSATDQVTVTVIPAPDADAGADQLVCPGSTVIIGGSPTSLSAGATFLWDNAATLNNATLANPTATPTATTTYTVTVTGTNGCTAVDDITITYRNAFANAGSDLTICEGGIAQIGGNPTGPAGAAYSWNNGASLNNPNDQNPLASPTVTTTYTVTVTATNGCTVTDDVTITVNPAPTADAGADQDLCSGGGSVTIGGSPTAQPGTSILWNNATTLSSATAANPVATPTVTTTYRVTVTDLLTSCTATDEVVVTINALPNVDAGPVQTICSGNSVQIGGSPTSSTPGATFLWSNASSLNDPTLSNPTASPTTSTSYTVTVTDANNCTSTDAVTVLVNNSPTADAGADQNLCDGASTTIGGSPTGPAGASYTWDNGASLSSTSIANPIANPTSTTTYTVTVSTGAGCTDTDQITVTIIPNPSVDAGSDQTICNGESVIIGGAPTSGTPGAIFTWDNGASLSSATVANPTASPNTTTTYTVTVTHPNGCTATDDVTVTVNALPTADAGPDRSVCNGGSIQIGGTPTGPVGSSFIWDNGTSLSSTTDPNPTASPIVTTTYSVTVTDAQGCSSIDNVIVSVGSLPTADAGLDQTICEGQSIAIGGSPTGPINATYLWDNAASLSSSIVANPTANPTITTTYSVTVTDGAGCSAIDQVTITVDPVPTVDAGPDQVICDGSSVIIGGAPTTSTVGATVLWDNAASLSNASDLNPTASPTITTTYTVVVTHSNGCTSSDQMTVSVNPNPIADAGADQTICDGNSATIGGSPTGPLNATFQWDNAATLSSDIVANPVASPTTTTTYSVTVTVASGCTSVDQVLITVVPNPDVDAGPDQIICLGESVSIGGSPTSSIVGASFVWDNAASLSANNIANPVATPTSTTTYTVTVTHSNGCTATDDVLVTVNPTPNADAGADQSICNGGSIQIGGSPTGPAGSSFVWDNGGSLSSNIDPNPIASPIVTTTYSVTVTDAQGCTSIDDVIVSVGSLPTADAGLDQTICDGESATIGGSPTGPVNASFSWDNGASLSATNTANPIASPSTTTTYSVTVTDGAGCSAIDQVTVTVNPLPTVDAGPDQVICDGFSVVIGGAPTTSTAGATILWDNAGSLDDATALNPTANPIITTTYTVTITHPNSCTDTDQMTVTVNPNPIADAGPDQVVCDGVPVGIGGSPTGPTGATYSWDNAATLSSSTDPNPMASPLTTTTYSVTVTDLLGCTSVDQVDVTVNTNPDADAGLDQTICEGSTAVIGGSPTSTILNATFLWDNATSLSSAIDPNPTANPIVTTIYTVTVTHTNGCTATDDVTITINPAPLADAGADQFLCTGSSVQIGGAPTGPVGATYLWDNAATLSSATDPNPTANPIGITTYTVTVTDILGCTNTDDVTISINGLPIADAGPDQIICDGNSATLGGAPTGPAGSTYTWDNAATLSSAIDPNPTATPATTTNYSVTVTDANGCTAIDQVQILVNPLPDADAGPDQTICDQQTVQIGGAPTSSVPSATFLWDNAASLTSATDPNPTANPSVTTTYTVTVTHTNGCTNTDQVLVSVNPLPAADAGPDQSICIGSSATIGGSPTGPGGSSFIWDNAISLSSATDPNPIATPSATTTYSVTVTDGFGCTNIDQVLITVNPIPDADAGADQTICLNETIQIGGSPTSGVLNATFLWDNATSLSSATDPNPMANPTATTTYTVTVTHTNGCTATDQVTVNVNPLPVVDPGLDREICFGASTTLGGTPTAPLGSTIIWDNAATLSSATDPNPIATPTTTTTYTVTVTDLNACTNTGQVTVTVNGLPIADAGPDLNSCAGSPVVIGGSPTGPPGASYVWDNAASLSNAIDPNPTATPIATTTYSVTVTDVKGCTAVDQVIVSVVPIPDADAGPDQTICDLQSIGIGGSPTSSVLNATFLWDNATSLSSATSSNPLASPSVTTTYTVTVTHTNGCTNTDQVIVNVNPLPTVDAGLDRSLCVGLSTTLGGSPTGPPSSTYAWDNAGTLNDPTNPNPIATPPVTTTYSVTVTDNLGCVNTDDVVVTVIPIPDADAGSDQTICELDTIQIGGNPTSAVVGATYAWDNAASLSNSTASNPNAFPIVTTTYTVTVTHPNACTNTDAITITVDPLPLADAGSDVTICEGLTATIGGSPTGPIGASYAWNNSTSLNDPAIANPIASPIVTTTYMVTVTDGTTGCTKTDQVVVTVNPIPVVDAGQDITICQGQSTPLGGNPTSPTAISYLWDNAASLNNASVANPLASPSISTTYSVTVTDVNGCTNVDQIDITVNPAPNVEAGPDQTICNLDSVAIGGSPTSSTVGATYSWSPVSDLDDPSASNPFAKPSTTTKYFVIVSDGAGCTSVDSMVVNVNPLPVVDFKVDETCISDLAAFTDETSISTGSFSDWAWDFGDGVGSSILQNPGYQYQNPGVYTVRLIVTSDLGCVDSISKSVTINALPVVDAGPDVALCFGDTVMLGGNPTGPSGSLYSWNPGFDLSDVSAANPNAYPLFSTSYNLSVTDLNGCINYDTVDITVNPLPVVTASPDTSICIGEPVQLLAQGAVSYVWSPTTYLSDPFIANPVARAETNIEYIVTGIDANGCADTDTISIEVFNLSFASPMEQVCFGDSVQLVPIVQGDETGISYNWTPSLGLSATDIKSPMSSPFVDQKYELSIANAFGCTDKDSVFVEVLEKPVVNIEVVNSPRCSGSVLEITNTTLYATSYEWYLNGEFVSMDFDPDLAINNTILNELKLIASNATCSDSITISIAPELMKDLLELKNANVFTPNGDGINDLFDLGFTGEFIGCAEFKIYDRWGRKIFDTNIGQYGWDGRTLRGQKAPNGIYYYVINLGGEEIKGSVFLTR